LYKQFLKRNGAYSWYSKEGKEEKITETEE
jgi:hypothetical protein